MHGNRDFMIGDAFAAECGITLLDDPYPLDLHGEKVLLSHGDAMCTDDIEYQQVRTMTRNPDWKAMMMAKSIEERIAFALQAREQSQARHVTMEEEIADVNQAAVEDTIREHGVDILLHGHTHRPAVHPFLVDDRAVHRIVLGDWYDQGSMVQWDEDGPRLETLPR
jgi:UDP-2,3-diacylglucosamine hydrolase